MFDPDKAKIKILTTEQVKDAADALRAIVGSRKLMRKEWDMIQRELDDGCVVVVVTVEGKRKFKKGSKELIGYIKSLASAAKNFRVEYEW